MLQAGVEGGLRAYTAHIVSHCEVKLCFVSATRLNCNRMLAWITRHTISAVERGKQGNCSFDSRTTALTSTTKTTNNIVENNAALS
jgi:hypothetical protein